ncbi:Bromodomain-domain-containing protein [Linderina pennispora]|uniref:Transcription initiation factor TFIID subunit 2 n=1 Tax=Linderina pennispora TaxID=61395 RepID=A0A1Y1WLK0_9FUNG|nr:Bromodomain-containing protein [Linderina pennispora]ORX74066.1 Bromodomain-domain-containing protein [Linderina pennispora]
MPSFVVNHQLVSLDIDFDRRVIKGLTELTIEPKTQDITAIRLHCERPVVRKVTINGVACAYKRTVPATRQQLLKKALEIQIPPEVRIEAAASTNSGETEGELVFETLRLKIEFYLVNPSSGIVFSASDTDENLVTVHTETQTYPSFTRAWLPCLDSVHARCTWDMFFSVPACLGDLEDDPSKLLPLTVVASGELSSLVVHPRDPTKRLMGPAGEQQAAKTSHNSKLKRSTVDAIGGVFAFTYPGLQTELETTCSFIPEALAFHSQEFGSYPYTTYKIVFMDGLREPIITCASLTIQVYETRRCLGLAIAQQWFGTYITPDEWSDMWLVVGLAGFAAGLFVKHNLGNNEYRYRLKRDMSRLCHADVNQRPISYDGQPPFMQLKAPIVLYMLDKRMMKGGMSLGLHRISVIWTRSNAIRTGWFLKMCRKVSGVDLKTFAEQWIQGTGCPVFHFSYAFNRKKLVVEITMHQESTNSKATGAMTARIREADGTPYEHVLDIRESCKKFEVQFNTKYKRIRRSTKRFHMRQMAAAAEELSVNADVLGIEDDDETYSNIALFGAENEQEKRNWRVVEWGEDDEESLASATFEWIRMDSDLEWACVIHFEQPDFMWAAQLQKDRDVVAQLEAVDALRLLPSSAASTTLMRTVMDGRVFYRVRVDAAMALERFAKESLDWIGLHHLIKIYKNRYCMPPAADEASDEGDSEDISVPRLPKPNNFANIGEYFTQKALLAALSNIRNRNNEAPAAARTLMIGALRYNDNSENMYSDCYYLADLVRALSNGIIASDRFSQKYALGSDPQAEDGILNEVERLRKLDMLWAPWTILLRLSLVQAQEHLFNTAIYVTVREVAVGGLLLHWGMGDPVFNRYFMMLATDSDAPRLATTVNRYMMEMLMTRSMMYGQQHNSLLFLEQEGSGATEYIDTDARLVGGLESFIETVEDSPQLQTILSSAMYDSTLAAPARTLLGYFHMLLYQTFDSSAPPPVSAAPKKLKIKLGSKRKGGVARESHSVNRSNASSDSEDVPLMSLSHATSRYPPAVSGGLTVNEDPYSADVVPGEFGSPPSTLFSAHGDEWTENRKKKRKHHHNRDSSTDGLPAQPLSPGYSALPAIAGTRPPPIFVPPAPERPAVPAAQTPLTGDIKPLTVSDDRLKLKLKLKTSKSKPQPAAPASRGSPTHRSPYGHHATPAFSPSMSPPQYHSTAPRVSSPLAEESRRTAWSPVYTLRIRQSSLTTRQHHQDTYYPVNDPVVAPPETVKRKKRRIESGSFANPSTSAALDSSQAKLLLRVWRKVSRHASAFPFMRPVDTVLDGCPTYYDVIKNPMDLRTVREKLDASRYTSMDAFAADMRLMLANCFAFNPAGTPVHTNGQGGDDRSPAERKASTDPVESRSGKADLEMENALPGSSHIAATIKNIKIPRTKQTSKPVSTESSPGSNHLKLKVSKGHSASPKHAGTSSGQQSASPSRQGPAESLVSLDDPDTIMRYLDQAAGPTRGPPVSQDAMRVCARVLLRLQALPAAMEFMAPVDPVKQNVPTYFDIIKKPMDLGTIRKKLDRQKYRTAEEFRDDVQLVLHNCFLYLVPTPLPEDPPMSDREHARARTMLTKLKQGEHAWPFLKPVDPIALGVPTYFAIVKNPMDFSTIQRKLTKKVYRYVADFVCDLRLLLDDCFLFNLAETPVNEAGKAVERAARAMLEGEGWARWF